MHEQLTISQLLDTPREPRAPDCMLRRAQTVRYNYATLRIAYRDWWSVCAARCFSGVRCDLAGFSRHLRTLFRGSGARRRLNTINGDARGSGQIHPSIRAANFSHDATVRELASMRPANRAVRRSNAS